MMRRVLDALKFRSRNRFVLVLGAGWTGILLVLFAMTAVVNRRDTVESALALSRAYFRQIMAEREWMSESSGVYVLAPGGAPLSPQAEPNQELAAVEGPRLTKLSPGDVIRQIAELAARSEGVHVHLISNWPGRPATSADPWEAAALAAIVRGRPEVFDLVGGSGARLFRYMAPLRVGPSCLACIGAEGYKVGGVRGGISISFSARPFLATDIRTLTLVGAAYGFIGVLGLAGLAISSNRIFRHAKRAEAAEKAQAEFLANMSHEIRTPLNGVVGMTNLLRTTSLSGDQQGYVEMLESSADSLLAVVNDILDISKIEAGKLAITPVPFDLRVCLEGVVGIVAPAAHQKGLEIALLYDAHAPRYVIGDEGRIRQMALNLVGNAVKFTALGHVTVEVGCDERNDALAAITISVSDTGIGIPENIVPTLFSKFRQADSSITRRYGGTGLGLAITKQLAELMGGSIGVKSEPDSGSVFALKLPLGIDQAAPSKPLEEEALKGVRVLVVDDHPISRAALSGLCAALGMCPDEAPSGEEALRRACEISYQIILLKRRMPRMDGLETLKQIRNTPQTSNPPVILVRSLTDRDDMGDCGEAGCKNYLIKPVRASDLLYSASTALGTAGSPPVSLVRQSSSTDPFGDLAGRRVLLAEDNMVNQKLAAALLRKMGCRVDIAADGVEAVHLAAETQYDIILMDCQMPEMDGFQATREIRERERGEGHVPIIALTAQVMASDREECLAAGMDGYVSKPIQIPALREALRICVG